MNHSGERPRYTLAEDKTEASLANWLQKALTRRDRSINKWPSGRQLTKKETAHLNSILRATVTPIRVGASGSKRLRQKQPEPERTNKLDMKSSQRVMKERCRELGLYVYGDKQALLARILNEENSSTTESQVKDSDTDQEMLGTFRGTESMPIMDHLP